MCVAGCVTEIDQNNGSYRGVARLQDAHICLFRVEFFPVAVLTVSVSKQNIWKEFHKVFIFYFLHCCNCIFGLLFYFFYLTTQRSLGNQPNTLSVFANCQEINIALCQCFTQKGHVSIEFP